MAINIGQFTLSPEEVAPILSRSRDFSFTTRFANRVAIGRAGTNVPVMDQDIDGAWVAEGAAKPVAEDTVSNKFMAVRKWAVIVPVTQEVYRANPAGILSVVEDKVAASYARAIDSLVLTGDGLSGATYINQSTKSVTLGTASQATGGLHKDLVNGHKLLAADDRDLTGLLFDSVAEPLFNGAVDTAGRPLFIDRPLADSNPIYRPGSVLGRPAEFVKKLRTGSGATQVLGYAGDWSRVYWGQYSSFTMDVSTEGTYVQGGTTHSAFQENLVLLRFEAEVGALVADPEDFVKFTAGTTLS